jgi:hypothetical protein
MATQLPYFARQGYFGFYFSAMFSVTMPSTPPKR